MFMKVLLSLRGIFFVACSVGLSASALSILISLFTYVLIPCYKQITVKGPRSCTVHITIQAYVLQGHHLQK
jgi:hypothetical protein